MMKKTLLILMIIGFCILCGYVGVNWWVKNEIEQRLSEAKEEKAIDYKGFHFNLINPSFELDSLSLKRRKDTLFAERISVSGIRYWDFIRYRKIHIKWVKIDAPQALLWGQKNSDREGKDADSRREILSNEIFVDRVELRSGQLKAYGSDRKVRFKLRNFDLNLEKVRVDSETLKNAIPFQYKAYHIEGKDLYYRVNSLQRLEIDSFSGNQEDLSLRYFKFLPNYSRKDYMRVIPYEKDLIDWTVPTIRLKNYAFDLKEKGHLSVQNMTMDSMKVSIFRNKLKRDDPNDKPMYSKALRQLSLGLRIDSLKIKDSELSYEEVQEKTKRTGKVFFTRLNMLATAISNEDLECEDFPETKVNITALTMGTAPINVDWRFKINNPSDAFSIKGNLSNVSPKAINYFFEPAFNMKASGTPIAGIYFNFYGDKYKAQGHFKMSYEELKIEVLKKNGKEKNKIFGFMANLFVRHKKSMSDQQIAVEDVKRNPKRSFWNYFWQCMFTGIKKTLL